MYRERMDHEEDPYHQFMSDGAQLWRRLTPNGENFTFRDPFKELPIEIQLKKQEAKRVRVEKVQEKQEAKRMRVEKAQEKQMLLADSRRNSLRRLRSIRAAMKVARAEARKKNKQDKQDSIRNRILRRLAKDKQGNLT